MRRLHLFPDELLQHPLRYAVAPQFLDGQLCLLKQYRHVAVETLVRRQRFSPHLPDRSGCESLNTFLCLDKGRLFLILCFFIRARGHYVERGDLFEKTRYLADRLVGCYAFGYFPHFKPIGAEADKRRAANDARRQQRQEPLVDEGGAISESVGTEIGPRRAVFLHLFDEAWRINEVDAYAPERFAQRVHTAHALRVVQVLSIGRHEDKLPRLGSKGQGARHVATSSRQFVEHEERGALKLCYGQ